MRHVGVVAVLISLGGCVAVDAPPPVPVVQVERIPSPPPAAITLIWQPGHYDWTGSDYVWAAGRWVPRAGHGPLWQDGSWQRGPNGWAWSPAHWIQ